MQKKIYIPDIECDSCVKLLSRRFKNTQGVIDYKVNVDSVDIHYDESQLKDDELIKIIERQGFRAGFEPFERKTFSERWRDFKENKQKYAIERKGLSYALYAFMIVFALEALAYVGFLHTIPNFLPKYGWWLFYGTVSVVALVFMLWHTFAYRAKVTCMVGMMIGMTAGMQTGMMLGAIIGATNGFFTGAMVGMLTGVIVGSLAGKSCGVMGIMEGMMAGVMGGTMGPMISVMMFTDRLKVFMPFYIIINIIIIIGLSYMLFEEVVENRKGVIRKPLDGIAFIALCIIAVFIIALIMIYGPKGGLFAAI
jgi:copper chaperone CopZ